MGGAGGEEALTHKAITTGGAAGKTHDSPTHGRRGGEEREHTTPHPEGNRGPWALWSFGRWSGAAMAVKHRFRQRDEEGSTSAAALLFF